MAGQHAPHFSKPDQVEPVSTEPAAFEALIRRHDPELRSLALRIVGPSSLDDVLQDAYLKAYRAIPAFEPRNGSVRGWLFRIVYTTSIDSLRRRRPTVQLDEANERDVEIRTPEDAAVERGELEAVLASLPIEDRAAIVLVDGLGFDYAAAAQILGIPVGTVGSRLHRGRAEIRRTLALGPKED